MDNYALYLRKSRSDLEAESHGEMETLARHEKTLRELAIKMKIPVSEQYVYKEVVSGETISSRPQMQQLLNEVENGNLTGVLVMEIERLARGDTIDQGVVARAFKEGNTKIITPMKVYDPQNEFDEEYFEFGLFMSRREYKTINRRIQRGRITSAKEGRAIISTPPYGYDKVKIENDKGYTLSPNEYESKVVQLMYSLYNEGKGMTIIGNILDEMKIIPRYRDTWSKSTISDILKNPVYIGKIRWSYRKELKIYIDGKVHKRRKKNDECIYVDGIHPSIITQEEFDKAQMVRKNNTRLPVKSDLSLKNPLTGIFFCKKCGAMMTRLGANKKTKYDTLKCSNKYCDNVSAPIFLVERKFISTLKIWLSEYETEIDRNLSNNTLSNKTIIMDNTIQNMKDELIKVEKQITTTYDLLEQNVYTVEIFSMRKTDLYTKKDNLVSEIEKMEIEKTNTDSLKDIKDSYIPNFHHLLDEYEDIQSASKKNKLLKLFVTKVEYLKIEPNRKGNLENDNFELFIYPVVE